MSISLGIIGGTGLDQWPGLRVLESHAVDTPYGQPSDALTIGELAGERVAFLARHGAQHHLAPHRVNYRANVWALHGLGVRRLLAVNAVGGITARMRPRTLVVPHQIIDYTLDRVSSYCDTDPPRAVRHVDFSEPYTERLRQGLLRAARELNIELVDGGVYGVTQGPRLETIAEIARMARDGCDLVGMTAMPEAVLARELDMDYVSLAPVANWAAGCSERGVGVPGPIIELDEIYANLDAARACIPRLVNHWLGLLPSD